MVSTPSVLGVLPDLLGCAHLCLHACPALLLLLPLPHVLILLLGLCHSLKELVKDAKEFIRLHFVCVFSKVLHSLGKLEQRTQGASVLDKSTGETFSLIEQSETLPAATAHSRALPHQAWI